MKFFIFTELEELINQAKDGEAFAGATTDLDIIDYIRTKEDDGLGCCQLDSFSTCYYSKSTNINIDGQKVLEFSPSCNEGHDSDIANSEGFVYVLK